MLAASNQHIDESKGSSPVSADNIRIAVNSLQTAGDVDGNGKFDANDAFLIHLVKLAGDNSQIDQFKGTSVLSAAQIRTRVDALGSSNAPTGRSSARGNSVLAAVHAEIDFSSPSSNTDPTPILPFSEDAAITDLAFANDDFRDWLTIVGA